MFNGNTNNRLSGIGGSLAGKYFFGDRFAVTAGIGIRNSKSTSFSHHPEDEDIKVSLNTIQMTEVLQMRTSIQTTIIKQQRK